MVSDPYVGKEIAKQYRIVQRIGSGGMGAVYRARQESMNRDVAIKILHSKYLSRSDLAARFRREARAMSRLNHPHIAKVYLYGQLEDGSCYIVMEYLHGLNLAQHVQRKGPIEVSAALRMMSEVCDAIHLAHGKGFVHRDLKPENIFLQADQNRLHPKVLDFGLAKVTEQELAPGSVALTREGMVFGTPEFMSPEQARGETLDVRSDIYSLGVILYEMLVGKLPFQASQAAEYMSHHINSAPIPLAEQTSQPLPAGLQQIMDIALAKDPAERFQSAQDFSRALSLCLEGKGARLRSLRDSARTTLQAIKTSQADYRKTRWWWFVIVLGLSGAAWYVSHLEDLIF